MKRYASLSIVIHWLTAVLIVAAYITGEGGPNVRTDPPQLHFLIGLSVLLLFVPRVLSRWIGGVPSLQPEPGPMLQLAARMGHAVLYLFLIALPLTGWYAASQLGVQIDFLGLQLPALAAPVDGRPGLIAEMHETGGSLILILAGLHAVMALWHHYILRDGTLRLMNPF